MKKRSIFAILALGVFLAGNAGAQQDLLDRLMSSRSWVVMDWQNSGTMGGWAAGTVTTGQPVMFGYPGWVNMPSGNSHSNYTRMNSNAAGFGLWVLSREGSTWRLSWSGPRSKSVDIVPLVYNPALGPEKDLGAATQWLQARAATFAPASNYWPGAPVPNAGHPRKIWNFSPGKYMVNDTFSEEMVISEWRTGQGIKVTRKALNWSYPDFDDFIMVEYYLTNETNATLEDVYLPLLAIFNVSEFGHQMQAVGNFYGFTDRGRDDWFKYTDAPNYQSGSAGGPVFISASRAAGLKLSYQFDGRSPFSGYDDTGEPWNKDLEAANLRELNMPTGAMTSYQFVGMAPVAYADNAGKHAFNINDRGKYVQPQGEQPAFVNWWPIRGANDYDGPNAEGMTAAQAFAALTAARVAENPTTNGAFTNAQVYGPYTIPPGETAKLVVAYVAGGGFEYGSPGNEPMDPMQWSLTATAADVAKGEQAIVENLEHALFAYQSGYDLPDAPPDVDFIIRSDENAQARLYWSAAANSAVHPDDGQADIAGYRIYRGLRGTLTAIGPYNLIATVPVGGPYPPGVRFDANATWPDDAAETDQTLRNTLKLQGDQGRRPASKGMYSWSDPQSNAGFTYYYSVRAYAKPKTAWTNKAGTKALADLPARAQRHLRAGLEGGFSQSMIQNAAGTPVLPYVEAAERMERPITVVPNPYYADGTYEYGGDVKIRFLNVPSRCYVYIFNSAGQLVQVLKKDDPNLSEVSWNARPYTTTQTRIGAGIYFFAVHSLAPGSEGKVQTGTFVMIR